MLHLSSPLQKTPQVAALPPGKLPELQEANLLHLYAAVGLNPPQQVGTAPRCQPMASCGIPEKAKDAEHGVL